MNEKLDPQMAKLYETDKKKDKLLAENEKYYGEITSFRNDINMK